jgi:integrase
MIVKRGRHYHCKFVWKGRTIWRSTHSGNPKVARQVEAALRRELALGNVGILERKPAPTVAEFITGRFLPWAESTFSAKPKTLAYYRNGAARLLEYPDLANGKLDAAHSYAAGFVAYRQARGLLVSSINRELQVLRRALRLALEWNVLEKAATIRLLPGEAHREHVISPAEEQQYLAVASSLLCDVATVLFDTGMRPEECFRMRWENLAWINGRHGTIRITRGKSKAARRTIPMTPRVRAILDRRYGLAGQPAEGFVWTAPTKSGHIEPSTLKKPHAKALHLAKVREFVLYSTRHTFATRLAPHVDPWTLCRVMGWSDVKIAMRYIHPTEDHVLAAIEGLQLATGSKSGSNVLEPSHDVSSGARLIA